VKRLALRRHRHASQSTRRRQARARPRRRRRPARHPPQRVDAFIAAAPTTASPTVDGRWFSAEDIDAYAVAKQQQQHDNLTKIDYTGDPTTWSPKPSRRIAGYKQPYQPQHSSLLDTLLALNKRRTQQHDAHRPAPTTLATPYRLARRRTAHRPPGRPVGAIRHHRPQAATPMSSSMPPKHRILGYKLNSEPAPRTGATTRRARPPRRWRRATLWQPHPKPPRPDPEHSRHTTPPGATPLPTAANRAPSTTPLRLCRSSTKAQASDHGRLDIGRVPAATSIRIQRQRHDRGVVRALLQAPDDRRRTTSLSCGTTSAWTASPADGTELNMPTRPHWRGHPLARRQHEWLPGAAESSRSPTPKYRRSQAQFH